MARHRKCVVCGGPVQRKGRAITCTVECAQRRIEQRDAYRKAERKRKREARTGICAACGRQYRPIRSTNIYCESPECKAVGLQRAINRQSVRRAEARQAREASVVN